MYFLSDEINNNHFRNAMFSSKTETIREFFQLEMLYDKVVHDLYYTDKEALIEKRQIRLNLE
jgi:hypothetical protein